MSPGMTARRRRGHDELTAAGMTGARKCHRKMKMYVLTAQRLTDPVKFDGPSQQARRQLTRKFGEDRWVPEIAMGTQGAG